MKLQSTLILFVGKIEEWDRKIETTNCYKHIHTITQTHQRTITLRISAAKNVKSVSLILRLKVSSFHCGHVTVETPLNKQKRIFFFVLKTLTSQNFHHNNVDIFRNIYSIMFSDNCRKKNCVPFFLSNFQVFVGNCTFQLYF